MPRMEPFSGRRGTDPHGRRFHLNPSRFEFDRFFAGFHGAAFIRMGGDVAFGAGPECSIDHSTIAESFALNGEEMFRGYMGAAKDAHVEVWIDAMDEQAMTPEERTKVETCLKAAIEDPCLSRIPGARHLIVFSTEHGQPIMERELASA